jgi:hypothetical protein
LTIHTCAKTAGRVIKEGKKRKRMNRVEESLEFPIRQIQVQYWLYQYQLCGAGKKLNFSEPLFPHLLKKITMIKQHILIHMDS